MNTFNFHLSNSDTQTITACLSVLPDLLPEFDALLPENFDRVLFYAGNAITRIANRESKIHAEEARSIWIALYLADMVNHGEIFAADDISRLCREHTFGITKLLPKFESVLDKHLPR